MRQIHIIGLAGTFLALNLLDIAASVFIINFGYGVEGNIIMNKLMSLYSLNIAMAIKLIVAIFIVFWIIALSKGPSSHIDKLQIAYICMIAVNIVYIGIVLNAIFIIGVQHGL